VKVSAVLTMRARVLVLKPRASTYNPHVTCVQANYSNWAKTVAQFRDRTVEVSFLGKFLFLEYKMKDFNES
jgi:2'-5' RNA ligase